MTSYRGPEQRANTKINAKRHRGIARAIRCMRASVSVAFSLTQALCASVSLLRERGIDSGATPTQALQRDRERNFPLERAYTEREREYNADDGARQWRGREIHSPPHMRGRETLFRYIVRADLQFLSRFFRTFFFSARRASFISSSFFLCLSFSWKNCGCSGRCKIRIVTYSYI